MSSAAYAGVDWGTSSFRLWLFDAAGRVLAERRSGEGMMTAGTPGFAAVLQSHLDAVGAGVALPVVICGMAGARQGWMEAGYVDTPAHLSAILQGAVQVPGQAREVRILPGLAQRDPGRPDVMRGEETQLLGALEPGGDALLCLPGTHSKWVRVAQGRVEGFATFMTGELFAVISRQTILAHATEGAEAAQDIGAFRSAVTAAFAAPALAANLLFQVRSGQLLHGGTAAAARERISGTLIGLEMAGGAPMAGLILVASGPLESLYQAAFDALSIPVRLVDAEDAVRRGLSLAADAVLRTRTG